ncbi:MAG: HDOD domain-containing protein [Deltaproteobacteria bacterium]|nr:HDOD domain-containing protein [Deltaproteobacteria bacterium]
MQNDKIIEKIGTIEDIPPLPSLASRIINVCFDEGSNYQDIAQLIRQDPVLTARVLRLINAPSFAPPAKINDLSHAISLLGKKQVCNLALSLTIFDTFNPGGKAREQQLVAFWHHCVTCAHASEELARKLGFPRPEEAFIAGLLHDIGKLVAWHRLGDNFSLFLDRLKRLQSISPGEWPPLQLEKELIGASHHLIGKWAAESWAFPQTIVDTVWLHHQPPPSSRHETPSLPLLVRFADALCNLYNLGSNYFINQELEYSTSSPFARTVDSLSAFFRIDRDSLTNIYHAADSRLHEFDSCLSVVNNEVYFTAIRKANRELGRLNLEREKTLAELSLKNRFLEALASLDQILEPDAAKRHIFAGPLPLLEEIVVQSLQLCQTNLALCGLALDKAEASSWTGSFNGRKISERELADETPSLKFCEDTAEDSEARQQSRIMATLRRLIIHKTAALLRNNRITPLKEHPTILVVPLCKFPATSDSEIYGQLLVDCGNLAREGIGKDSLIDILTRFADGISNRIERRRLTENLVGQAETITELNRQNEEVQYELLQAHRLATVGRLAAGAAHEINNPLTVISGQVQILKNKALHEGEDQERIKRYDRILVKVDKIARIVSDLLAYGRPQKARPQPFSIKKIVQQTIEAVAHRKGFNGIRFSINIPEQLPEALVDPQQLGQVLINLLINAQMAMPDSGSIGISAGLRGSQIEINLSDTGCGIAPEHLPTIFDPFFTTRDPDSTNAGTGLGLSIAHSLIEANRGSIEARSTLNKGTTFTILLPLATRPKTAQTNKP